MNLKEIKKEAIEVLKYKNNWLKLAVIIVAYYLIYILCNIFYKYDNKIGALAIIVFAIFSIPLAYGVSISFLKVYKKEKVNVLDFIMVGGSNFYEAWEIFFRKVIKLLPWILIVIIVERVGLRYLNQKVVDIILEKNLTYELASSVYRIYIIIINLVLIIFKIVIYIKSLYYCTAEYITYENENVTAKNAIEESEKIITKNKDKWRKLALIFIGIYYVIYIILNVSLNIVENLVETISFNSFIIIGVIFSLLNYIRIISIIICMQLFFVTAYKKVSESHKVENIEQ